MVRDGEVLDDLLVVVRATPRRRDEAIADIAADALRSGRVYAVVESGRVVVLYGVSVFALRPGVPLAELLVRFDEAPSYLQAPIGRLREAGFDVLPTGVNPDHFDVQLLAGDGDGEPEPVEAVSAAAERLVLAAGDLRRNPAYTGSQDEPSEEQ
jgi:hypothetical protein